MTKVIVKQFNSHQGYVAEFQGANANMDWVVHIRTSNKAGADLIAKAIREHSTEVLVY